MYPDDFVWGAATAAFQIEGATRADGRGESIWDRFAATPGKVLNGDTGEPACEHYYRLDDDLELMSSLGLEGYRFSIAWPRVQPLGRGAVNQQGLDFYRRLVDGLQERGIRPFATLYHWDLPQALEDGGGWVSRDVVERFVEYAHIVFDALGDSVEDWITLNEPWVQGFLGYGHGSKAPGVKDWGAAMRAAHHLLLAHGKVVEGFRARGAKGRIGITVDLTPVYGDPEAARKVDGYRNRWFLDPLLRGTYPEDMVELYERWGGPMEGYVLDGDLATISAPSDFMGVNFYHPTRVSDAQDGTILEARDHPQQPVTGMGWEVRPEALVDLLQRLTRDYSATLPPLYITENGAAYDDVVASGAVDDRERLEYVRGHVAAIGEAIDRGVDLRGYFVWSLLDNYEWEWGYSKRFGIVHVDYATQERIPKASALWYRDFIAGVRAGTNSAQPV